MTVGEDGKSSENVNPRCFFDVEIGGLPAGRVIFELFSNVTPKTAENFRALCTGEKGIGKTTEKPLHYKGSVIHRVIKDFMIQGGDFSNGNGTGGESIYGGIFEDENFELQHDEPYLLSMANRGPATNGSQFFILTQAAPHLNGIHVVFGRVLHGQAIVKQIEGLPVDRKNRPLQDVKVSNSGELVLLKKKKEKKPKKDKKKKKDKGKDKSRDIKDGGKSSGEISDTTDSEAEKKKSHKDKKLSADSPTVGSTTVVDVAHPLATESTLDAGEIPPDPPKRFLSRIAVEKDKDDKEVGSGDKKSKRDREKVRSRSRERERDRGDRDRGSDRNRDWRSNRDRGGGGDGGGDRFAPRYGRSNFSATGRKIKGRGRVCYRTPSRSRSRSRSKTPPHWKAETRRTISMKEFEEKEKARKQREGELRRRQLERQKRHEEQEKDVPEPKQAKLPVDDEELSNHSAEDALGSSPISKTLIDTLFEASNSDGVVYYQHLYNKGRDNRKGESSLSKSKENDASEIVVAPGSKSSESSPEHDKKEEFESIPLLLPRSSSKHPIVAVQSETSINVAKTMELVEDEDEEMRLRRELLKKRLKEWEDSSDEDKKAKQSVSRRQTHSESVGTKIASKTVKSSSEDTIQAKLMKFSQVNVDARVSNKGREDRVRSKSRATVSRSKSRSRSRDRRRDRQREKKRSRSRSRSRGRRDRERDRKRRRSTTKSSSSSRSRSRSRDRRRRR